MNDHRVIMGVKEQFDTIVKIVCQVCKVGKKDIFKRDRGLQHQSFARNLIMHFAVKYMTSSSTKYIGDLMTRDHSTIVKGSKRISEVILIHEEDRAHYNKCNFEIRQAFRLDENPEDSIEYYI